MLRSEPHITLSRLTQDNYKSKIDWLFHQFPAFQKQGGMAYKPGLSHTQKLLEYFKLDVRKLNTVHVAGTNGKGSTCSILASLLTESKKKIGLFTSPHIFDFRERIRVNGTMISEKEVSKFVEDVQSLKLDFKPSFFEITFVLAVKHFLDQNCDYCVFETGMGGRLDATNVLTPIATAITNISLDHTEFLGDTLEEIAKEKAGIIKANTPLFIGIKEPHSFSIFEALAKENLSKIIITDNRYTVRDIPKYQNENLNLAVQLHEYITQGACSKNELENAWQNIKKNTGYAKRMESISQKPQIFLDVAHNDEGILASIKFCRQKTKGKLFVIFGGVKDKKYNETTLELLNETFLSFCLFSNERTKSIEDWQEVQKSLTKKNPIYLSIHEALNKTKPALKPNDTLLVTGSFFLTSDFNPAFWK